MNIIKRITKWITGDRRFKSDQRNNKKIKYEKPNRRKKERRKQ